MKRIPNLLVALCIGTRLAAQLPDIGPPPGKLVDIGGRRLHVMCSGAGSPTIVLEAGASAFAIDWTLVQREIARTNRVCSYDRARSAWSDSATATTRGSVAHDLHALLQAVGAVPPYVMVGASLGGIFVRLYQADYPDEVVGLVLIDPASEERLFTLFGGKAVTIASLTAEQLRTTIPERAVAVPRRSPQTGPPFDRLPRDLYELRLKLDARLIASVPDTVPYATVIASAEGNRARLARLKELSSKQAHPLGDRPVVVLTRGVETSQELQDVHAALARLSTNSRHTVVAGAGHEIHLFEPGAVVQAVADVVQAIRTKTRASAEAKKRTVVTTRASGTFDVKLNPLTAYNTDDGAVLGRMSIDKQFHGDLVGTSKGEMLTAGTGDKGSAGYVAVERVTGTLHGRSGTFALQHSGTMTRGAPQLAITVVPDSGTGQLVGIAGKMAIIIADGKHSYEFEYTLNEAP